MIKRATPLYKKQIVSLWTDAFGGNREEVYEFYKKVCPLKNTVVDVSFFRVRAMATALPVKAGNYKGGYIYAVATSKKHRNQGRCGRVLNYINRNFDFDFTFLKPSEESLFRFYEKYGYTKEMYIPDYSKVNTSGFEECSAKEYLILREKHLENFVEWDEKILDYILTYGKAYKRGEEILLKDGDKIIEYLGKDMKRTEKFALARAKFDLRDMYFNIALE